MLLSRLTILMSNKQGLRTDARSCQTRLGNARHVESCGTAVGVFDGLLRLPQSYILLVRQCHDRHFSQRTIRRRSWGCHHTAAHIDVPKIDGDYYDRLV